MQLQFLKLHYQLSGLQSSQNVVSTLLHRCCFTKTTQISSFKHRLKFCFSPSTRANTCVSSPLIRHDASFHLVFSEHSPLSNWSGSEYNYGENHPGLMWEGINGIKKIICWPSGLSAAWDWKGNLKQRRRRDMEGLNEGADGKPLTTERLTRWAAGRLFSAGLVFTISPNSSHPPHCPHTLSSFKDVQEQLNTCA